MGDAFFNKAWQSVDQTIHKGPHARWIMVKQDLQTILGDYDKNKNKFASYKIDRPYRVVDTFAGGGGNKNLDAGWSQAFQERGDDLVRIEFEGKNNPNSNKDFGYIPDFNDIMNVSYQDIVDKFGGNPPDIMCGSPPCEGFSVAGLTDFANWKQLDEGSRFKDLKEKKREFNRARNRKDVDYFLDKDVGPKALSDGPKRGRSLMNKYLDLVRQGLEDNPDMLWVMENPMGMMRYQPEVGALPMIQPKIYSQSKYKYPDVKGVSRPRIERSPTENPIPSITHASYSGPFSRRLGGTGKLLPGVEGLPDRKATDLWGNLSDFFEARPPTKMNVHPNFDRTEWEKPTRYYPEGRKWPPKYFGHAGLFHTPAERGGGGLQRTTAYTNPKTGEVFPPYWMKSLIPADLGRDLRGAASKYFRSKN